MKTNFLHKTFLTLLILSMFLTLGIYSQPAQVWMKTYTNPAGTGFDHTEKSIIDPDGNIYAVGTTRTQTTATDILLLKYNSSGTLLWSKTYNYSYNGIEQPNDMYLDNQGNIYVAGTSTRGISSYDGLLLKYNSNGSLLWVKRINKTNFADRKASAESIAYYGALYIGVTFNYDNKSESGIVKYNTDGDSVSYYSLGILNHYSYRLSHLISDNSVNLYAVTMGDILPNEEQDFIVKKISINGNISQVWSKTFSGASHKNDHVYDLKLGPDGNIFVTGATEVNNQSHNVFLIKYGRDDGAILFQKTYNNAVSNGTDFGNTILFDAGANIFVIGGTEEIASDFDPLFLKYSPAGTLLWSKTYNHPGDRSDIINDAVMDNAGNIYTTGITTDYGLQTTEVLTLKFSSSGDIDWFIEVDATTTNNGSSTINLDNEGNVVISGHTQNQAAYSSVVRKYGSTIGIEPVSNTVPESFELKQNYPNPFNPVTNIRIQMPKEGFAKLTVFDVTGKEVAMLVNENLKAGEYNVDFNASNLTSGVYFYRLVTDRFTDVKKMMLIK